jgi:precorrin-2 dehydrogenase / sirohydrochlorin ferrochelatase
MRYLPIQLDVQGREALIIGASADVLTKIDRLIAAGARVTVIAAEPPCAEIEALAQSGSISVERRAFEDRDLDGKVIVFLAPFHTPHEEALARRIYQDALRDGRLVCAIDRPEASTFVNAAMARAPGLTMTFSTGGQSPGTARRIREDLEALFADPRWEHYLSDLGRLRATLARGERAARMAEAVKGFAVEARLRFPEWLERGRPP